MLKKIIVAAVLAAALVGCVEREQRSGGKAADFTLQDLSGKDVRLSNYGGRVVLLEFWATWCPPCRASIPGIEKLHEKYGDKGLTVLAVSVDDGGWDDVRAFVRENGIKYSVLKGTEEVASAYGARSIPMLLLIDRTGAIARRYLGAGNDDDLEQDIRSLL